MILSTLLANWANRHYADFKVNGSAMAPALTSGKVVLVKKTTTFRIDDIVVFKITYHSSTPKELIDRVVALSGDRVVISGNKLSVYDSSHQNGYNPSTGYDPNVNTVGNVSLTVPVGYVYVLGDNRSDSLDSRTLAASKISCHRHGCTRLIGSTASFKYHAKAK